MPTRIFSIRHHGPGSAQNLQEALGAWQPQQLLIEGPPEAETVTDLARSLEPPVALLLYSYDQPQTSVYYPFTIFSPEWQALQYGLQVGIPIHWLDLPQTYQWVRDLPIASRGPAADPLQVLAQAAGEGDGDRWWEELIEQRPPSEEVFDAILEAMSALRDAVGISESDRPREAAMRQTLRRLQRESPQDRLAVICGAWHGPALSQMPPRGRGSGPTRTATAAPPPISPQSSSHLDSLELSPTGYPARIWRWHGFPRLVSLPLGISPSPPRGANSGLANPDGPLFTGGRPTRPHGRHYRSRAPGQQLGGPARSPATGI